MGGPHPICKFISFDNRTGEASGLQLTHRMTPPQKCIRLTFYKSDVWLSGSQISKKWQPDGFVRVPYQNLQKSIKIKNLTFLSFLATDKHCTMVENLSLSFNHPQNLQKWHYRRCIWEKTQRLLTVSLVWRGWVEKKNDVF